MKYENINKKIQYKKEKSRIFLNCQIQKIKFKYIIYKIIKFK